MAQPREEIGPGPVPDERASGGANVLRLEALGAAGDVELDLLPFLQGAETISLDGSVVAEQILAPAVLRDETEALRVVEPLHGTSCHLLTRLLSSPASLS